MKEQQNQMTDWLHSFSLLELH